MTFAYEAIPQYEPVGTLSGQGVLSGTQYSVPSSMETPLYPESWASEWEREAKPKIEMMAEVIYEPPISPKTAFRLPKLSLGTIGAEVKLPHGTRIANQEVKGKINISRLLATDVERLAFAWFCDMETPFDFETSLLGGRAALNFAKAPFILNEKLSHSDNQAIRFFTQMTPRLQMERDVLLRYGYDVIDLAPMAVLNDVNEVLGRSLEFI